MFSIKRIVLGLSAIASVYLSHVAADATTDEYRATMVKEAFQHAWRGYSRFAYGHDELQPMTNGTTDSR